MKTKKTNLDLILEAKEDLDGKWLVSIAAFLVVLLAMGGLSKIYPEYYIGELILIIVGGAIGLGIVKFSLAIARKQDVQFMQIFDGFHNFFNAMKLYFVQTVLFATLPMAAITVIYSYGKLNSGFSLLILLAIIVIGIVIIMLSLMYGMSFFILADNPNMGTIEVLTRSRKMMYGYKWKLFGMMLWSLLFGVLGMLALLVGLFFVIPVLYVAYAKFYEEIK